MAKAVEQRLTRWIDPQLGELTWDGRNHVWEGLTRFAGRLVSFSIICDLVEPTREDQLAIIEPASQLLPQLPDAELELRWLGAQEIAAAVVEQQDEIELHVSEFLATLELTGISLYEGAGFHYRSPGFFPGNSISVYANADLSYDRAEVTEDPTHLSGNRPRAPGSTEE